VLNSPKKVGFPMAYFINDDGDYSISFLLQDKELFNKIKEAKQKEAPSR
jgi:hypothetical protein